VHERAPAAPLKEWGCGKGRGLKGLVHSSAAPIPARKLTPIFMSAPAWWT